MVVWCEWVRDHGWTWYPSGNIYVSVAQFDPGTWHTASHATRLPDPENLYHVGANVAYWSSVVDPWTRGGWENCW